MTILNTRDFPEYPPSKTGKIMHEAAAELRYAETIR
jgi:hypothetical protein